MNKIQTLIEELKQENIVRAKRINETEDNHTHTALVHQYNLTIEFIITERKTHWSFRQWDVSDKGSN